MMGPSIQIVSISADKPANERPKKKTQIIYYYTQKMEGTGKQRQEAEGWST